MSARKPLWQLSDEELERLAATGTEQERKLARTILVNRQLRRRADSH